MLVPGEIAFGLYHHYVAVVVLSDGARRKVVGESCEFFGEVDFGFKISPWFLTRPPSGQVRSVGWNFAYVAKSGWSGQADHGEVGISVLLFDFPDEAGEQVVAILGAGGGFGVVLDGENGVAVESEAGVGAIKQ